MTNLVEKELEASSLNEQSSYFDHKINVYRKHTSLLVLIAGLVNLLLLVPDLALIENASARISIIIIRVMYSIILFVISYRFKSIVSFKPFSIIVSICEIVGIIIFLFVFCQYSQPDFLIQAMGLISLFLIIFLIPNRWFNMMLVASFGAVGFFVCALIFVESTNMSDFFAALVYVIISLLLCAVAARNAERHQFSEFTAKSELEHISTTDYLTKTANRYKMEEYALRWMAFCKRQELPLSLVFIDVDDLKIVNDQYGHAAGDFVLASLAELIQNQLRKSDVLARWGGDEFVMLLPNVTLDNAITLTRRIETCIRESTFIEGINITCSFGLVEMKKDSDFEAMICEADNLMYECKKHGKNSVQFTT